MLRLMRSFIKKEGMVYFEIIHSICITNFIPKIVMLTIESPVAQVVRASD